MQEFDFAIVGAGIAGVSAAYHLAPQAKVVVLEREHVAAYPKGARGGGGVVGVNWGVAALDRRDGRWTIRLADGETVAAAKLINASGAWADVIAGFAGARPVGLVPKRRTAFTFDAPTGLALGELPMVIDFDETWYIKPEVGQFLGSPADETPSPPTDAQPEEIDIAIAVERIQTATTLQIHRIKNKWAGLRSFVADKNLVVGYDEAIEGFFWLAGQGGYGIQTAAPAGRLAGGVAVGPRRPTRIGAPASTETRLATTLRPVSGSKRHSSSAHS